MRLFFHALALLFLASITIFSQTPSSTAIPADDDDIVKISTSLIQLDVTATDSRGRIVTDLTKEDFEVYENGEKQDLTSFSFVSAINKRPAERRKKVEKNGVPDPPAPLRIKKDQVRRTIALVVDDLTLSFESIHFVRRALKKFVNEQMQEGDLVAIIRTGGGIGALQQFTYDRSQLLAAAENVRWNPLGGGGVGVFAPIEATLMEKLKASGASEVTDEMIKAEKERMSENNQFRADTFVSGTLGAVNYIVRGMQELPGRKSIVLLSDGFKLFSEIRGGFSESTRIMARLEKLIDEANRASVVVYSIDARGLQTLGFTAADNTNGLSTEAIRQRGSDRREQFLDSQDGLRYLSENTGGLTVLNNNDINNGIEKILDDQSYYLIGYEPDSDTFDPEKRRFNKIDVKVKRRGVKVRYRSGFFGVEDTKTDTLPANLTPEQRVLNALSSPFAVNDIRMSLNTLFKSAGKNNLALSSFVHINAKDLKTVEGADGKKSISFDILAMNFGENGVPLDQIGKTYTISLSEKMRDKFEKDGFVYYFTFPLKKPGAYQMRVAIRDHATNKVGSANLFVEAPNLKKNRLSLSGLAVQNISFSEWKALNDNGKTPANADTRMDTSRREFKRQTVLIYGFDVYNAKLNSAQKPELETRTRVFYNGKLLYEGENQPASLNSATVGKNIWVINGALRLGSEMKLGDYVLQVVITDKLAKRKRQIATQFVQFEIVK